MVETVTLDALDRRILHALQLDGRAPFARIAAALGVSERAVSRRYHRMRSRLVLRVVGVTGHHHAQSGWFLHIATPPASAEALTRALATRDDTSWVASLAGDGGLTCILRTTEPAGNALESLRRRANSITAYRLLKPVAGVGGWPGRLQELTADEREALTPTTRTRPSADESESVARRHAPDASIAASPSSDALSPEEDRLLTLLATDGRMSIARLAATSGIPESTVRRRISELTDRGALMFEVEIDPKYYGRNVDVVCRLDVQPAALHAVTEALATHTEVAFAATTTGPTNVLAILEFATDLDIHDYLADRLGALPGVHRVHTDIVSTWVKRAGPLLLPPT